MNHLQIFYFIFKKSKFCRLPKKLANQAELDFEERMVKYDFSDLFKHLRPNSHRNPAASCAQRTHGRPRVTASRAFI